MAIALTTETGENRSVLREPLVLSDLAQKAGLQINTRCGGNGTCGGCTCRLGPGEYKIQGEKISVYEHGGLTALSCQTHVLSEAATVHFPRTSQVEKEAQIDADIPDYMSGSATRSMKIFLKSASEHLQRTNWDTVQTLAEQQTGIRGLTLSVDVLRQLPEALEDDQQGLTLTVGEVDRSWIVIEIERGDTTAVHYGVAIDIGTTTVAALLIDLNQNTIVTKASMYNQQIVKADDVASRISYCRSKKHLLELQKLVVKKTINSLLNLLCEQTEIKTKHITRCAVSGNTVMSHLFLGLSPLGIGTLPFTPVTNEYQSCLARQVGLNMNANGIVDIIPSISGYIGGDITSDIYIAKLDKTEDPTLLIDIGTNGEIVFKEGSTMTACATAAGPAFEGYGITHGCRASTGAVEKIRFDSSLEFDLKVIGNALPSGICGSGIIDFIAEGMRCGLINQMGRFDQDALKEKNIFLQDATLCGNSVGCIVADESRSATPGPLCIFELDIAQVMKAKAAIYAGIKTLLQSRGKRLSDIQHVILAGGFARYINIENAITIGLLPERPLDIYEVIGNGSLAGAVQAMTHPEAARALSSIIQLPSIKELNTDPNFEPNFIEALALPNLDEEDFPETMCSLSESKKPEQESAQHEPTH